MSTSTRKRRNRRPRHTPAANEPTVDLRKPLPTRHRNLRGHSGIAPTELAEIRAALHATGIGIRVPVLAWRATHNGARIDYGNGNHLVHDPTQPVPLTAYTLCPHGAHHAQPITGPADLARAVQEAAACREHHAPDDFQWPDMVRLTTVHTLAALDDDEDHDPETTAPAEPAQPEEPAETPAIPAPAAEDPDRTHEIDVRALRADHDKPEEHPEP